jgi:hypothetical protein
MSIDLRKIPVTTFQSRYNIGDWVWFMMGVYQIPIKQRVLSVRFQYDEFGVLVTYYIFKVYPQVKELTQEEVFTNEQDCYNSI